ncbi:9944_t:CDS:2 [Cetraspora pellucida]|uniref:9944_t:CDS:1 n=1 Tax=Cetraspora pellucida TaxID=1433469 RepID=A0A9N9JF18_9GLOM|nr:9944_t:CDS:2 [Cetraspora pellucida]
MSLTNLQNFIFNILKETKYNIVQDIIFSRTSALAEILGNDFGLGSPIAVSPLLGQKDLLLYENRTQKKYIIESSDKSNKRQKLTTKKIEPFTVKKLIKKLKDDSVNKDLIFAFQLSKDSYTYLYKEIVKAKANNDIASQKAQSKVDKEVKEQLPKEINDTIC